MCCQKSPFLVAGRTHRFSMLANSNCAYPFLSLPSLSTPLLPGALLLHSPLLRPFAGVDLFSATSHEAAT